MGQTLSGADLVPSRTGTLWPKDEDIVTGSPLLHH